MLSKESMKLTIRQAMLQRRVRFPAPEWKQCSQQIQTHLRQWPVFKNARIVHIYVNIHQEVETRSIIRHCWQSGKTVIVPYLVPQSPVLGHSVLSSFDQLTSGTFDLREPLPESRVSVDLGIIDLVIVPGVAFDKKGGRLGHGGGYYDLFLSRIDATMLGICFSFQIVCELPQASHDIPMHAILTEEGFAVRRA
jgi:5-formyltetrahydrofolate cyclo-ligase